MSFNKSYLFCVIICFFLLDTGPSFGQESGEVTIARVKYRGGGDWYNDPSALRNLLNYSSQKFGLPLSTTYDDVELGSPRIFNYPFLFLTGHGSIQTNAIEIENLRTYLSNGGFLYIDDDYGLDSYARTLISEVFPESDLIELPFDHPIYQYPYPFSNGLPKIHEHDGKPSQGLGVFHNGRLVVFYSYESNLGDGWANPEIHNPPKALREDALKMGTNILIYSLTSIR